MAKIEIHDLRLSFIWVETVLDLVRHAVPSGAPLAFLGRRSSYAQRFEQVLRSPREPGGLEPPWRRPAGHFFWTYYLRGRTPGNVSGDQAWKALVPFRGKVPAAVEAPWLGGDLVPETFLYPHGLALVVTALCRAHLPLEEAVEKAFEVRQTGKFQVEWDEGRVSQSLSLDAFVGKALTTLGKAGFGPGATPDARSVTPFTLATVVRGTGVHPNAPVPDGGKAHRALEAITTWRPTWRYDVLPNLAEVSLQIRRAPPSHVLYYGKRGRAVWFPGLFIREARDLHSLACYHRNLVFASLQVESLSGLVSQTAKQIRDMSPLSVTHRECARRAVGILGRLYGGLRSTYRSRSPRAHIEQNDLVMVVNEVRDFFNMPLLS